MIIWIFLSVIALLFAIHWCFNCTERAKGFRKIQGLPSCFILGNTLEIWLSEVELFRAGRKWANTYKDIYRQWLWPYGCVNIYNPVDIETILSNPKYNSKSFIYEFLWPWLGGGLLVSDGPKWFSRRKILTPAFHFNILRHFSAIIEENSWKFAKDLENEVNEPKTNVEPLVSLCALNTICETAMGTKLEQATNDGGFKYKKAIHDVGKIVTERLTRLWLYPNWIFNLSLRGRAHNKYLENLHSLPRHVINERREYRQKYGSETDIGGCDTEEIYINAKSKRRLAMLDLLLEAEKHGLIDETGIQEEVDTFMFEGHDTTSSGLCFALMILANNKNVQDTIMEELNGIFKDSNRPATMSDLADMRYLECCIKESLRLYPPVPFISRNLGNEPVQLKDYLVPANALCHVHIFDLHRRADLYENPEMFDPDRFLPENCVKRHPYAYIPFSAGPRNCIGQKFAMMEMKSVISAVLRHYELLPVTKPQDIVFKADVILRANHPIYVKFVKRQQTYRH